MQKLASVFRPVIWLLEKCTNGLLRVLGVNPNDSRAEMSIEEVRELVLTHEEVPELIRPISAYPRNKKLLTVLSEMQTGAENIAAVVDEYGELKGMVTLEDVVEELVGQMYDEYDRIPTAAPGGAPSSMA